MEGRSIKGYVFLKLLGKGGFGEVWLARDPDNHEIAIKFEKLNQKQPYLQNESQILQHCQSECFPAFYSFWYDDQYAYLAMESLSPISKYYPNYDPNSQTKQALSFHDSGTLALQMLKAIEQFHSIGYIHRDIKASNFLYRNNSNPTLCLIDFGLSKPWMHSDGYTSPPKSMAGFHGTTRYASVASHLGEDLSRRDDLWSLLYIFLEMIRPPLPWANLKTSEAMANLKRMSPAQLMQGLPRQFEELASYLNQLKFESNPDYEFIRNKILQIQSLPDNFISLNSKINAETPLLTESSVSFDFTDDNDYNDRRRYSIHQSGKKRSIKCCCNVI